MLPVSCFTQEERDSGKEEENKVLRNHSWGGMQVYTEWDKSPVSRCDLGSIKIVASDTKGISQVLLQFSPISLNHFV